VPGHAAGAGNVAAILSSGSSSGSITAPSHSAVARAIMLRSSRMLPGHA
jgi:hypothetical protein